MISFILFLNVVVTLFRSISLFWLLAESAFFGWISLILIRIFVVGVFDFTQRKSTVLRNYPPIRRVRFLFKEIHQQIRQYFLKVEDDEVLF